jgi:hypothetical protein
MNLLFFIYSELHLISFSRYINGAICSFHYSHEVILFHLITALLSHISNLFDMHELNNSKIIFKIEAFEFDKEIFYDINFEYTLDIFNLSAETFTNKLNQYLEKENIPHCICDILRIEVIVVFNKKLEN